jgi:hypothetical protein
VVWRKPLARLLRRESPDLGAIQARFSLVSSKPLFALPFSLSAPVETLLGREFPLNMRMSLQDLAWSAGQLKPKDSRFAMSCLETKWQRVRKP